MLRASYEALSDILFGASEDDPEEIVAQLPALMEPWGASDRIEELWKLVQFLDQCLSKSLFQPNGVLVFDAFARAHRRAQSFLQKEVDELPPDVSAPVEAPTRRWLH
ncbi:MAG: hypothetical protein AAGA95_20475 [Pseudomonadota bacterium]